MYTTYHFSSAQEVSTEILDAIKATFKAKPITITVEETEADLFITDDMKAILDERLSEDETTYMTAEDSITRLVKKYGL